MRKLKDYLGLLKPGPVSDTSELSGLLAECWGELDGGTAGGMKGDKLVGRMEDASWNPPLLSFSIERHGGTVHGSTRAERQGWVINVDEKSTTWQTIGHRQLRPRQPNWDAAPVAEEIAKLIAGHQDDERLKWNKDGSVRVIIGKILPEGSAVNQTLAGRRRRLRTVIDQKLGTLGWKKVLPNVYAFPINLIE